MRPSKNRAEPKYLFSSNLLFFRCCEFQKRICQSTLADAFNLAAWQRPGFIARFAVAGQRPASCQARMSRAFSAPDGFWGDEPRALPWAGMNDALGVSNGGSCSRLTGRLMVREQTSISGISRIIFSTSNRPLTSCWWKPPLRKSRRNGTSNTSTPVMHRVS